MTKAGDSQLPVVAFLGIGLMGEPMARLLLAAGHRLTVWNRTPAKARRLAADGAAVRDSPGSAVFGAEIVIVMLADGPAVTEVLFNPDTISRLAPGAIVVDMSSIPPALARDHAARLSAYGVFHLDAPVSGGTRGATDGTLAIMVGGPADAFETACQVLKVLGRPTLVGPSGSGQLAKLANQAIVAVTIGAVAEALVLVAAGGADPVKVKEAVSGGFADSAILKQHGQRMLERAWVPGGSTRMQLKDLRTILAVASDMSLDLPLTKTVAGLFEALLDMGFGSYDHSALLLEIERRNPGVRVGSRQDQRP